MKRLRKPTASSLFRLFLLAIGLLSGPRAPNDSVSGPNYIQWTLSGQNLQSIYRKRTGRHGWYDNNEQIYEHYTQALHNQT